MPQEIAPLVMALNRLFTRLNDSFTREREFTDHAAHELRTPLAAMKTQTQVLIKKARDIPECTNGLKNLQSSINRATHLLEQLLSLARLQHEKLPQDKTDLAELLRECVDDLTPCAHSKNITINKDITKQCLIMAHANSIEILLNNLLDNAIKYTPSGSDIFVNLSPDGVLSISDTGAGLNDDDKQKVFERFVRVDKTGQNGSGLGLSIVKWIADAHGLHVLLQDNTPNGLVVTIKTHDILCSEHPK